MRSVAYCQSSPLSLIFFTLIHNRTLLEPLLHPAHPTHLGRRPNRLPRPRRLCTPPRPHPRPLRRRPRAQRLLRDQLPPLRRRRRQPLRCELPNWLRHGRLLRAVLRREGEDGRTSASGSGRAASGDRGRVDGRGANIMARAEGECQYPARANGVDHWSGWVGA